MSLFCHLPIGYACIDTAAKTIINMKKRNISAQPTHTCGTYEINALSLQIANQT